MANEWEEFLIENIRAIILVKPGISDVQLAKQLSEKTGKPVDRHTVGKLKKKIIRRRTEMLHRANIVWRVGELREKKEQIDRQMWKIIFSQSATNAEKIMASKTIMESDLKLLQAEMDAGVFERHLGTFKHAVVPVPPEHKLKIIKAMQAHGIVEVDQKEAAKIIAGEAIELPPKLTTVKKRQVKDNEKRDERRKREKERKSKSK